jgi:hypothetical protein
MSLFTLEVTRHICFLPMKMPLKSIALTVLLASPLLIQSATVYAVPGLLQGSSLREKQAPGRNTNRRTGLLQTTRDAIIKDMASRTLLPASQLRITQIEDATFDGCLSIAPRDAICQRIGLPGWRVTVQGSQYRWTYHAIQNQKFQLNGFASAPRSVTQAALQDAARLSRVPVSQLQVNWVEQKTWRGGCFDLPVQGGCTPVMVPGWQVTIAYGEKRWVYHTDSANTVRLNQTASKL